MKINMVLIMIISLSGILEKGYAQPAMPEIRGLEIGDTVPDLFFTKLINQTGNQVRISDLLKGKNLLIINFWATWCVPCIRELPLLDSIKSAYSNTLAVLAVSHNDSLTATNFANRHPEMKIKNILITSDDSVISKYFPHRGIPENVWIDKNRVVKYVTGGNEINERNINMFLTGKTLNVPYKKDYLNNYWIQPLSDFASDSMTPYRSLITRNIENVSGVAFNTTNDDTLKYNLIRVFSSSIFNLYWMAFSVNTYAISPRFLEVHTMDSTKFFNPEECPKSFENKYKSNYYDWKKENCYAYELNIKEGVRDTLFFKYMLKDLQRYFKFKLRIEQRSFAVTLLKITPKGISMLRRTNIRHADIDFKKEINNRIVLKIQNATVDDLCKFISENLNNFRDTKKLYPPVLNGLSITYPFNLTLDITDMKVRNYEHIKDRLIQAGFEFEPATRNLPVLIIEDE